MERENVVITIPFMEKYLNFAATRSKNLQFVYL